MYIYRVQLVMQDYRQVDITSDTPLSNDEIEAAAIIAARGEFGDCDNVEVEEIGLSA